ncbi:MAG: gliding motility-associated C-terminal domain-containing protein [Bacteroidia bacterium]|nr:gliding motility-associated C-terminal domain-containing protein [Bacteroidia bacterium]
MKSLASFILLPAFFLSLPVQAQIFFNNGATIYTAPQSVIQVNGGIENNSSTSNGNIDHNGTMNVTLNSTLPNPGDVTLNNNSTWQGDGITNVEGDWVNNAIFQQDLSDVRLMASTIQQRIMGTNVTTFHILRCQGTGTGANRIKLHMIDANVDHLLDLTDRELSTDVYDMNVLNPQTNAIINLTPSMNQEGLVSSLAPGVLSWVTDDDSAYLFPVGSSTGNLRRYRPVQIEPTAVANNTWNVRMINWDPDFDNYPRNVNDGIPCLVNDTFYHSIVRVAGTTSADLLIAFDPTADGFFNGMAHWSPNIWTDMNSSTQVNAGTLSFYSTLKRVSWPFADADEPYALTELKPGAPSINCPQNVCANSLGNIFTANGSGSQFTWTVGNGTIVSGQGTDSIVVSWTGNSGWVYVIENSPSGCPSLPDSCFVTVSPAPIAGFDTNAIGYYEPIYQFTDTSNGATSWQWNFGDPGSGTNNNSNNQNPNHQFSGAGTYIVTLIVTNAAGCTDTITTIIEVDTMLLIPNVFTPNGDGQNDEFYIPNSGMENFHIQIYNRWGTLLFETTADEIRWDGRSTSGILLSDGTYYYILDAVLKTQSGPVEVKRTGWIQLLTKKKT